MERLAVSINSSTYQIFFYFIDAKRYAKFNTSQNLKSESKDEEKYRKTFLSGALTILAMHTPSRIDYANNRSKKSNVNPLDIVVKSQREEKDILIKISFQTVNNDPLRYENLIYIQYLKIKTTLTQALEEAEVIPIIIDNLGII